MWVVSVGRAVERDGARAQVEAEAPRRTPETKIRIEKKGGGELLTNSHPKNWMMIGGDRLESP